MPDITIDNLRVAPTLGDRVPTKWKAYCVSTGGFLINDADNTAVSESSPYTLGPHYKEGDLTDDGLGYVAADFTLPSTTDSPNKPDDARWGLFIFDANDRLLFPVAGLEAFPLDHTDTTQTPDDIIAFMLGDIPVYGTGDRTISGDLHVTGDLEVDGSILDPDVEGDMDVTGTVTAGAFVGNGAGITGLTGATGGVANTGSTTIGADTDDDSVGVIDFQIGLVTKGRLQNDGKWDFMENINEATLQWMFGNIVDVKRDYGAIADGSTHPLSGRYASLGAAQVDFSFVTSLTQEIDWACIQKMVYESLGYPTFEHADTNAYLNIPMYLPPGKYMVGADTVSIKNASGIHLQGAGRRSTLLKGSSTVFATDGLWYSQIQGIAFENTSATTVTVDIDGNVPGHAYATRGIQGNTFKDIFIDAAASDYGLAMCRLGGSGAQGSENLFINCHINDSTLAGYYQTGFNALTNKFIGGNFQANRRHGIQLTAGSISVDTVGFQSNNGYTQIANGGFDIDCSSAGVNDRILVTNCRSESLRFFRGSNSQRGVLIANYGAIGSLLGNGVVGGQVSWGAGAVLAADQFVVKTSLTLGTKLYRVTTPGTTGGSQPTWPDSGTVVDGGVTWTQTEYRVIDGTTQTLLDNNFNSSGFVYTATLNPNHTSITADYVASFDDEFLPVDTSAGNVIIYLRVFDPTGGVQRGYQGKRYYIKKTTTDMNTVTVKECTNSSGNGCSSNGNIDGPSTSNVGVIPGGSRGHLVVEKAVDKNGTGGGTHWVIARSPIMSSSGSTVASAAAIVPTGEVFHVSGTTTITSITTTGMLAGSRFTMIFDGILTVTDGSNMKMAGNFVTTADDTITFVFDGTNCYESARSVN